MNNKAVLALLAKKTINVKYGKWNYFEGILHYNWKTIAEYKGNKLVCHSLEKSQDVDFEYNTFNAIRRVIFELNRFHNAEII